MEVPRDVAGVGLSLLTIGKTAALFGAYPLHHPPDYPAFASVIAQEGCATISDGSPG
jgi:hypothetical protein